MMPTRSHTGFNMSRNAKTAPAQWARFGQMLRSLRAETGVTQSELARQVGFSRSHVASVEVGRRAPPPVSVVRTQFLPALGIPEQTGPAQRLLELAAVHPTINPFEVTVSAPRTRRLPPHFNSFVGRNAELAELHTRLDAAHASWLITLLGPGGAGKTRLAVEAALKWAQADTTPVYFVDLTRIATGSPIDPAVADALQTPTTQDPVDLVLGRVADTSALLILDNCEHVIDTAARFAEAVLTACPGLRIIATSRESLRAHGEYLLPVSGLDIDNAMRLFTDRAQDVTRAGEVGADHADLLRQTCQQLDGLPLAIEITAAQLHSFGLIALQKKLAGRFVLDMSGQRTVDRRHATLRGVIAWSYELLTHVEQQTVRRLSVFSSAFDLSSAEAVAGLDSVETELVIRKLRTASLLTPVSLDDDVHTGERFRMLETIRQFMHETLAADPAEYDQTRERQLQHYAPMVGRLSDESQVTGRNRNYIRAVRADIENIRGTLAWACTGKGSDLAVRRLVRGMVWFCHAYGYWDSGVNWHAELLRRAHPDDRAGRARDMAYQVMLQVRLGQFDGAAALRESLVLAWSARDWRVWIFGRTLYSWLEPDPVRATHGVEMAVKIARREALDWELSLAMVTLAQHYNDAGKIQAAHDLLTEALAVSQRPGAAGGENGALRGLGENSVAMGRLDEARAAFERALHLSTHDELVYEVSDTLWCLTYVAWRLKDTAQIRGYMQRALDLYRQHGHVSLVANYFSLAAGLYLQRDNSDAAVDLLTAAESVRSRFTNYRSSVWLGLDALHDEIRSRIGPLPVHAASIETAIDLMQAL
jgi:predicted ATPase/transcriptional regulator with XRE-family HTH domain/Tfp pilus assembly protein PilF